MIRSLKETAWLWVLVAALGLTMIPAAGAWAQDGTDAADDAAAVADDAAAATEGEAAADGAAATGNDPLNQAALPTVDDSELEGGFVLPALGFLQEFFVNGGPMMWPLAFSLVFGIAVILERIFTLSRARVNTRKLMSQVVGKLKEGGVSSGIEDAIEICQRTRGPIAAILHAGLMRARKGPEAVEKAIESAGTIEMAFLQRGLVILASIAYVAPLLGFLGTVSGMIGAFNAIAEAEQVSAKLVASGISEALITTATGLAIAIPMQLGNNFFISRIDRFVLEMEEASVELVDTMVDMEAHRA